MNVNLIDKENTSGLFAVPARNGLGNVKKFDNFQKPVDMNTQSFSKGALKGLLNTPKSTENCNQSIQSIKDSSKQRRALGDVLNTASRPLSNSITLTPKTQKCELLRKSFKPQEIPILGQLSVDLEEEYPPIEQHHPLQQIDTFNDLFEGGKLSDLMMNKNVQSTTQLPSGIIDQYPDTLNFEIYKENNNHLKKVNQNIKQIDKRILLQVGFFDQVEEIQPPTGILDLSDIDESF